MRSHSPDIADDINREIAETGMRLANLANGDNTMTVESAISMRHEDEGSQRSGSMSSDGSQNKRAIKSNIALQNKQK